MTEPFADISITGVDTANTRNVEGALYDVPLILSARPPAEWVAMFDAARSFARHSMWCRARVSGGAVIVQCCLDGAHVLAAAARSETRVAEDVDDLGRSRSLVADPRAYARALER